MSETLVDSGNKPFHNVSKEISMGYFTTGLAILIVATLLGFLNRLEETGMIVYSSSTWYTLMTLHGMAAFVGWGAFVAIGLTFYTITRVLDAPLHSPNLVKVTYYIFVLGFALIVIATLYGQFAASWVFLFPLPFYGSWQPWATTVWTLGVLLAGVGIILAQVEVLLTIKSSGHSLIAALGFDSFKEEPKSGYKVPLAAVPFAVNALSMIIATVPFAVLLVLFLFQSLGADLNINALVAKNVLWWFGHPIVYQLLFPVAGFAYFMVGRFTKSNRLVGERIARLTWAIAVIIQNIVGSHHVYQDLVQPLPIQISQQVLTYVITLPSVSSIFVITMTLWVKNFEWHISVRYLYLATLGWFLAGMSGLINATILLNTYVHNTLWIVAHFHTMAILNITMMLFGMAYFLIEDYSGRKVYSNKLALWGMWLKFLGTIGLVHMWFFEGILGGIRRTAGASRDSGLLVIASIPFALMLLTGIYISTYVMWKTVSGSSGSAPSAEATPA